MVLGMRGWLGRAGGSPFPLTTSPQKILALKVSSQKLSPGACVCACLCVYTRVRVHGCVSTRAGVIRFFKLIYIKLI